ncbi:MAG: TonB family protein [Candidatus Omnitrophica bacterium]|nr:TonB family protein [Candidatus Omnitrophota bacterium]
MKRSILLTALFLAALNLATVSGDSIYDTVTEDAEEIKLYLGGPKVIPVSNPTRIAVSNPNIMDVTNVTRSEVTLSPKAVGNTTLLFWDSYGEQTFRIKVLTENMLEIKARIDKLLASLDFPEVYTRAQEDEGKVMLLGRVKTPQDRERITLALGALKEKAVDLIEVKEEETLIEIDANVMEISKDSTTRLGFGLPEKVNILEVGSPGIPASGSVSVTTGTTPSTSFATTNTGSRWDDLFRIFRVSRDAFTASIDALVVDGKAKILSRPRLACQSGKEAQLMVGGEKPTFSTFTGETSSAVEIEYKEYGIKVKVRPTVMKDDRIKLGLNIEVSEVGEAETIGTTTSVTAKAYPVTKRNISTELFINNEETVAIGGLIKQSSSEEIRKVPFLGDIPVVGLLFRNKTATKGGGSGNRGDTELFITLTPSIIARDNPRLPVAEQVITQPQARPAAIAVPEIGVNPIKDYASIIQQRIMNNLEYPSLAKKAGFQGIVKLSLQFSHVGALLGSAIGESSGYKILDDNALNAARSIASYPPFPVSIEQNEIWIEVPIAYRLD